MLTRRFLAIPALLACFLSAAPSQEAPPPGAPEAKGDETSSPEKPDAKVDIKKECRQLEEVFRRRTALHYLHAEKEAREKILKSIDPVSARQIKALLEKERRFKELDYHFTEKARNCEQRILNQLRLDRFRGVEDILEAVKDVKHPLTVAYANLLATVDLNFRFARRKGLLDDEDFLKEVAPRLTEEEVRVQGTAGHDLKELAREHWKEKSPDDFPAWWFDQSSGPISFRFAEVPGAPDFPQVDLNTATREQLLELPSIEVEMAEAIIERREKEGIQGPEELRLITRIPAHLREPLQTLCKATHVAKPKKWTVMVYLNAANNLEPFGIEDMNEMEQVGSTRDVNIVVECARFHGHPETYPNPAYLGNPFQEHERVFYFGLDNEPGTRRYYILEDDDPVRVRSVLKANVGPTDAGRPEPLADFGRWAIENYPAEHYALVIWDHGAGWSGVSSDENTRHHMDLPEVREALAGIVQALEKQDRKRIDILDFDACLMATLEVAYELEETVDYLLASQESEPGDGMPYDDYLRWLVTYPEASPFSVAKAMVDTYVRSYGPEGSQTEGDQLWLSETKSAIRLRRIGALRDAVERVAALLLERPDLLGEVAEEVVSETRSFGRLVDIQDFFTRLAEHEKADPALKAAVKEVNRLIGYPNGGKDTLVNEVVIKRRSPGEVIWGWNGWKSPPRQLAPFFHESRHARTPLVGPDEHGNYVARIKFPPRLENPETHAHEFVKVIDYRFKDESKKRTITDFENAFVTTDFPDDAVVCAEGHLVGNHRAHGISIYFPAYLGFDKDYLRLRNSKGSYWTELVSKFPLKPLAEPKAVGLLGLSHFPRSERERLGRIVVREELEEALRRHDRAAATCKDLEALGIASDAIGSPLPYGLDWEEMSRRYADRIIVLDNHDGLAPGEAGLPRPAGFGSSRVSIPRVAGPEGRTVMRYLRGGGHLLLASPEVTRSVWDTPLYRDTLGLEYRRRWNRSFGFKLRVGGGQEGDDVLTIVPARKGEGIVIFSGKEDVQPLAVLAESGEMIGARVDRTDPATGLRYKAVVLGFHWSDIPDEGARRKLLKEAMTFLDRSLPATPEAGAAAPQAPAEGVGSGNGND